MSRRKERVREGLEIGFDLLDSDLLRCYVQTAVAWNDLTQPILVWMEYTDREGGNEEEGPHLTVMMRTLDNDRELAEARRMLRLLRYKSYACVADLADRKPEEGEFVIRTPPRLGNPRYVSEIEEARMPAGLGDPDAIDFLDEDPGVTLTGDVAEAVRLPHAEAIRLAVRIMEVLGYDIPGEHGDYYEPVRADVAEELHARATRRPRTSAALHAIINDLSREP
jgi:hypothetical protein